MNFFYSNGLHLSVYCLFARLARILSDARAPPRHDRATKTRNIKHIQFIYERGAPQPMMPLSHAATQSLNPCRFLLLPPRDARASSTCLAPSQTKRRLQCSRRQQRPRTHIHKLRLCQRAVAVLVEDSPHNIEHVRPQLQGWGGGWKTCCWNKFRTEVEWAVA